MAILKSHLIPPAKFCIFTGLVCLVPLRTQADPAKLTEADRIALTEQLENLENNSKKRVGGLFKNAVKDFRSAIRSDDATMALYLKCYEKVNFLNEKRKASDFREWKRRNKEEIKSPAMRMALRHQLSWLLLSIEAAKREGDVSDLGNRASEHLDQIFRNAAVLQEYRGELNRNVLDSVFARAYKLHMKVKNWPTSALDIKNIYEQVIMPPLRSPDKIDSLRNAWDKRIKHETLKIEMMSRSKKGKASDKNELNPKVSKFLLEARPVLLWKKEVDCFKAGDQRKSALRMVRHLEKYMHHKETPRWIKEFKSMIEPKEGKKGQLPETAGAN